MTTAMSAHQEPPRERLGPPAAPAWQPKRNKRKDFKPRCAPAESIAPNPGNNDNPDRFSPADRNYEEEDDFEEDRMERDDLELVEDNEDSISKCVKIGVKNMVLLKGAGAVDLSGRRISTDSNENIESSDFRGSAMIDFAEHQKRMEALRTLNVSSQFQQSYIQSLQLPNLVGQQGKNMAMNSGMTPSEYKSKNFSTKSPFAISQLIKTNSPTRRRDSDNSDELDDEDGSLKNDDGSPNNDGSGGEMTPENRDKDEPMDVEDGDEEMQNGETRGANKVLTDYAVNTMKELLGIYGLSSNEVTEALTGQVRAIEAMQAGKPYPVWLQRRWSQGAMGHLGQLGMMGSHFPEDRESQSPVEAHRSNSMQDDSASGLDSDGDRTLDLSLSKDHDVQDLSTASSAGNSVAEFEQQSLMMRRNLEDLAGLHGIFSKPQVSMENEDSSGGELRAKLSPADDSAMPWPGGVAPSSESHTHAASPAGYQCVAADSVEWMPQIVALLASLGQLDGRRQAAIPALDYSRYVKRYGSALECGSSYCKDLGYREHFHCLDCSGRVFCKKEEMIRHFKWHKKRDESLAHGFMRYSPLDDCGERGAGCPHNRSQTHYHCIQDGCDKVYISTSDVQMHANYHRKDSAILQEGFQRFRATERCSAPHCAFRGQRTTHFHCRRPGCRYTFKNKADMEKHKTYHIKDEQLARDGFKKYMKNEPCPYRDCRFSRMCNHIHCIRPRCNYVLHSSSQLFSHKRKHERKDQELNYGIPSAVMHNAMFQQSPEDISMKIKQSGSPKSGSLMGGDGDDNSMSGIFGPPPLIPLQPPTDLSSMDAVMEHQQNLSQLVVEEVCRKYIHTFNGGADEDDKCQKCSAFNKHYHCLAEGCNMAHSCHSTMVKHSLEHEHQCQVTEAYFQTFSRSNPCNSSSCHHIRDAIHYHCTWENCGCVILPSEDQPFRRLEHHRQHALLSPLSPTLGRLAHALTPNALQSLNSNVLQNLPPAALQNLAFQNQNIPPNILQGLPPSVLQNLPPSILQNLPPGVLQNLSPSLLQNLNPNLLQSLNPSTMGSGVMQGQTHGHAGPASSLDEMFSRKRGRPPKNRVVEVWADHSTPQAIFTSFKLPKSSQPPMPQSPCPQTEEFSKIKFHHFDVYTTPDACGAHHPACQIRSARVHMHCSHCAFTSEDHPSLETHSRESHSVPRLLEGFDYYQSCDDCNVNKCVRSQMRSHFHCSASQCSGVMTQYSSLIGHKHRTQDPEMEVEALVKKEEVRDYSMKGREAALEGFHGGSLSVKSEIDLDAASNVSVVKAAGTFYPSSHERASISPSSSRSTPCQQCSARPMDSQGPCTHQAVGQFDGGPMGLAATKETLEREYPEISILPSTASSTPSPSAHRQGSQATQNQPTLSQTPSRLQQQAEGPMRQAVHSLLLQQYLAQAVSKPPGLDHIKYHQQLGMPQLGHKQQLPFLRSPFPLYPGMMYPPELLMDQSGLMASSPSMASSSSIKSEKDADLINKRAHPVRSTPNIRMLKDEPIPEGYLRFRFNEDCAYQHCGYREHQTHFHCTRRDCGYSFCDKTRFVQHTARHERLDTLMGGDFQQYRANVFCGRQDCAHASNFGVSQNKASHFHCLKCEFVCTDTNKVVAHRRQHQKMDSIQAAGFDKFPPSKGCGFDPQCIHSKKQTHYHCLQCGFAVLGLSQMTSHKYRHQENSHGGAGTSGT